MKKVKDFFNRIGRGLLTPGVYNDARLSRRFYRYFLIGILARLILLPFFFQRDLLSTFQRAAETVYAGNFAADVHQVITHTIHSVYLFIIESIVPAVGEYSSILLDTNTWTSWINFIAGYNVFT